MILDFDMILGLFSWKSKEIEKKELSIMPIKIGMDVKYESDYNYVLIDMKLRKKMGLSRGDEIMIIGKKKYFARLIPYYQINTPKNTILINDVIKCNLENNYGDKVIITPIWKYEVHGANFKILKLKIIQLNERIVDRGFLNDWFEDKIVMKNMRYDFSYFGRQIQFIVEQIITSTGHDEEFGWVRSSTQIENRLNN